MNYIYSTGNEVVDSLRGINFTGNIIPQNWYKTITNEKGKPDLTAIVILADVLYWYRPSVIRSEETGEEIGLKKKFSDDDYLQRSYSQIERQFGLSKRSARNAVVRLEQYGLVKRVTKNFIASNGIPLNNVMFLELNVPKLLEITFPDLYPKSNKNSYKGEIESNFDVTNKREIPLQQQRELPQIKERSDYKISGTNTKITTNITTEKTTKELNMLGLASNHSYPSTKEIEKKIKYNIAYDVLKKDKRIDENNLRDIFSIMIDVFNQKSGTIHVNSVPYDIEQVQSKFLEINQYHFEFVLKSFAGVKNEIRNIRAYIITALYNAPSTMDLNYFNKLKVDSYY